MFKAKLVASKLKIKPDVFLNVAFLEAQKLMRRGAKAFIEEGAKRVPVETGQARGAYFGRVHTFQASGTPVGEGNPTNNIVQYLGADVAVNASTQFIRDRKGRFLRKREVGPKPNKNLGTGARVSAYTFTMSQTNLTFEFNTAVPYFETNDELRTNVKNKKRGFTYPWKSVETGIKAFNATLKKKLQAKQAFEEYFRLVGGLKGKKSERLIVSEKIKV